MFHVVLHAREKDLIAPLNSSPAARRVRSRWIFALWLVGWIGLGGLHRLYLGKPKTGLLYLFSLSLCGVGLIWDLAFLPALARDARGRYP